MRRLIFLLIALTLIVLVIGVNASAADELPQAPDGVRFDLNIVNSWGEVSDSYVQFDGAVINDLEWSIHGWVVKLKADSGAYVENAWNCYASVDNGVITVTPGDYINTVPAGESVVFGIILRNAGTVETAGFNVTLPDGSGYEPPEYAEPTDISEIVSNQKEIISQLKLLNEIAVNFFLAFMAYMAIKAVMYVFVRVFFSGV